MANGKSLELSQIPSETIRYLVVVNPSERRRGRESRAVPVFPVGKHDGKGGRWRKRPRKEPLRGQTRGHSRKASELMSHIEAVERAVKAAPEILSAETDKRNCAEFRRACRRGQTHLMLMTQEGVIFSGPGVRLD